MSEDAGELRLYGDLAPWFHLLTAPADYVDDARQALELLAEKGDGKLDSVLELGSGGGNNASHMKDSVLLTLVDRSAKMLDVSLTINPDVEHIEGDMCTVRLGREFDGVFVHDAASYLTTEEDLSAMIQTAYVHCRPGGSAVFAPDFVRENFKEQTEHGGHSDDSRGLRYLLWIWDPDPRDETYVMDFAYLLREGIGQMHVEQDRHLCGAFPRATWTGLLAEAGFEAEVRPSQHDEDVGTELFVASKPASS